MTDGQSEDGRAKCSDVAKGGRLWDDRELAANVLRAVGIDYPVHSFKIEWSTDMLVTVTVEYYPMLVKDAPNE